MMAESVKKAKVEYYVELAEKIVMGKSYISYIEAILYPDRIAFIISVKAKFEPSNIWKETPSVWKDAITFVNRWTDSQKLKIKDKVIEVIKARLDWITGKFSDKRFNKYKRMYMQDLECYSQYFSKKVIDEALDKTLLWPFIREEAVFEGMVEVYRRKGYMEVGKTKKTVNKRVNGRYVPVVIEGSKFLIPNPHQAHLMSLFTKKCANLQYPFLSKYSCDFYGISKGSKEFYVRTEKENGVLYIPYDCLIEKSMDPAIKRMNDYFVFFYKDKAQEHLDLMKTKVFADLKRDIEGQKIQS